MGTSSLTRLTSPPPPSMLSDIKLPMKFLNPSSNKAYKPSIKIVMLLSILATKGRNKVNIKEVIKLKTNVNKIILITSKSNIVLKEIILNNSSINNRLIKFKANIFDIYLFMTTNSYYIIYPIPPFDNI